MSGKHVNVRLDAERVRKANALHANGVARSDLVRQAIDEQYDGVVAAAKKTLDTEAIKRPAGGAVALRACIPLCSRRRRQTVNVSWSRIRRQRSIGFTPA
jgi:hypothetical protein